MTRPSAPPSTFRYEEIRSAPGAFPAGSAPSLTVRADAYRFGEDVLFRALHFSLDGGQTTCLLGPSGVGKSTLLRMIAGLPGRGAVPDGLATEADDGAPVRGRLALMSQDDQLLPWLSVRDNVLVGYRLRGEPITAQLTALADGFLNAVGLSDRALDRPSILSGGMRQRVSLARTLAEQRPIVLMDEPFSALDAITRIEIGDLAARCLVGRTVLLITHDPLEALRLGHRIVVLSGRPAQLTEPIRPRGRPPRDPGDRLLLDQHAHLLSLLTHAQDAGNLDKGSQDRGSHVGGNHSDDRGTKP